MLDHLDLNVSDLKRSRAFYAGVLGRLGYRPSDEGEGWCSFVAPSGSFYLVLVQTREPHASSGYHRKRVGLNHLAFAVESPGEVEACAGWLAASGIPALYGGQPLTMGQRTAVFFEDPDRVKIEIVYRPA